MAGPVVRRIDWSILCSDSVTGEPYLEMLRNFFWTQVSNWDNLEAGGFLVHAGEFNFSNCIIIVASLQINLSFFQDGAPPHFSLIVRKWLDEHFPMRWIGRHGPVEWPPPGLLT